jgi:serine/threonine protein kinase
MFIRAGSIRAAERVARDAKIALAAKSAAKKKRVAFEQAEQVDVKQVAAKPAIASNPPGSTDIVFPSHSAHPQSTASSGHMLDHVHRAVDMLKDEQKQMLANRKREQLVVDLTSMEIDSKRDVQVGKSVGKGGFAEVYVGQYLGQQIAIKKFSNSAKLDRITNEWNLMRACFSSPYINPVYGYDMNTSMIIIKYADRGSLHGILSSKTETLNWLQRIQILRDITAGLDYLHNDEKIIHRDIKSGNILVSTGSKRLTARISDFSEAIQLPGPTNDLESVSMKDLSKNAGTVVWMSPECMLRTPVTTATDIYSFGMLLLEMALDHHSFKEYFYSGTWDTVEALLEDRQKLINQVVSDIKRADASLVEIADLIQACTCYDADKRPDAKYILKKLDILLGKSDVFEEKAAGVQLVAAAFHAKTAVVVLPKLNPNSSVGDVKSHSATVDPDIKHVPPKVPDDQLDVKLYVAQVDDKELLTLVESIAQNYNPRYERSNIMNEILEIVGEAKKTIDKRVEETRLVLLKYFHPKLFANKSSRIYFFATSKTDNFAALNVNLGEYDHLVGNDDKEIQILHAMLYALSHRDPKSVKAMRGETRYQKACNDLTVWDVELKAEAGNYEPAYK